MNRRALLVSLMALPLAAAFAVVLIALLSREELAEMSRLAPEEEDPEALQVLRRSAPQQGAVRSTEPPALTEEEVVVLLSERSAARAAAGRLWPLKEHRARLFEELLSEKTYGELRLFLLGRFQAEEPTRALDAARSIAKEERITPEPLLLAVYEILALQGGEGDLALLSERPAEPHQLRTLREAYRDTLLRRLGSEG